MITRASRVRAIVPVRARVPVVIAASLVLVLALPFLPPFAPDFRTAELQLAASLTIVVLGLTLLTGLSGQISLGHSGFVLGGAYVAGLMVTKGLLGQPLHPAIAIVFATAASGALGLAIGVPALRLSGPYLAIVTVGFALVVPVVLKWDALREVTGGTQGLLLDQPSAPFTLGGQITDARWRYFVVALPALGAGIVAWNVARSRFGRAFVALRESEAAAAQLGIPVARYKVSAFGLSAAYAGLGGSLSTYASLGIVTPDSFGLFDSINYLIALVVGGAGTIVGAVLGALFITYERQLVDWLLADQWTFALGDHVLLRLPSLFRAIDNPAPLRPAVYGVVLVLTALFAPRGLAGLLSVRPRLVRVRRWRPRRPERRARLPDFRLTTPAPEAARAEADALLR